jgi:hypothetical protein
MNKIIKNFEILRAEAIAEKSEKEEKQKKKFSIGLFGNFEETTRKILQVDINKDYNITEYSFWAGAPSNLAQCKKYDRIISTFYFYLMHKKLMLKYAKTGQLIVIIEDEAISSLAYLEPKNINFLQLVYELKGLIDFKHIDAAKGEKKTYNS